MWEWELESVLLLLAVDRVWVEPATAAADWWLSAPFVRRRCDCLSSSAPFTNTQTYLLTYLLTSPIPLLHCTLPSSRFFQFYLAIFLRNRLLYRPTVQYFERILSKVSYCVAAARHSLFYFRPLTANCGDVFTLSIFRDAASSALHESALERTILDWYQPSRVSYLVDRSAYNVHFISASFIRYL